MSSKIRYLLLCPNDDIIHGSKVIAALCKMVQRNVYNLQLPEGWLTLKTQDKLKFLAKSMPKGYELLMLREPKWTRKNKSLYQKVLRGDKGREIFTRQIPPLTDPIFGGIGEVARAILDDGPPPPPNHPRVGVFEARWHAMNEEFRGIGPDIHVPPEEGLPTDRGNRERFQVVARDTEETIQRLTWATMQAHRAADGRTVLTRIRRTRPQPRNWTAQPAGPRGE